jgi:CysZ protein
MIKKFFIGFRYPFKGLSFIFHHGKLAKYVFIPFLINLIIFSAGFFVFLTKLDSLLTYVPKQDAWYYGVLYYFLAVVLIVTFLILAFYLFTIIGNIIASPFSSTLSEKVEELELHQKIETHTTLKSTLADARRSIGTELKRLLIFILIFIPILIINFIPLIGQVIYFILMLIYTWYALTFTFMDYILDRKYKKFREKNRIIFSRFSCSMGFGAVCFICGMMPIVNLMLIPVCVTGGTLMYLREYKPLTKEIKP